MQALILKGKFKDRVCDVSQWCNDWFMLEPRKEDSFTTEERNEITRKVFSPGSLAFSFDGMKEISAHENNGILFGLFYIYPTKEKQTEFGFTFKKKQYNV